MIKFFESRTLWMLLSVFLFVVVIEQDSQLRKFGGDGKSLSELFMNTFWQTPQSFRVDGLRTYDYNSHTAYFIDKDTKEMKKLRFITHDNNIKIFQDDKAYVSGEKTNWFWYNIEVHLPAAH